MHDLEALTERIRAFARARDWEHFHNPKNHSMALIAEAAELVEHFQWLNLEQSAAVAEDAEAMEEVADEIADVAIYLLRLADVLGVDVGESVERKLERNEGRFSSPLQFFVRSFRFIRTIECTKIVQHCADLVEGRR